MTITEFLQACIADDEARVASRASNAWHDIFCGWNLGESREAVCHCGVPKRMLAECEAKRRIVEDVVPHLERVEGHAIDGGMYEEPNTPHALRDLLHLLALPYADHPDYQPEWKP